jgi:hypothetical protein
MRTLLKLVLIVIVLGVLGLAGYVTFVEIPHKQTEQMIEIPSEAYDDRL